MAPDGDALGRRRRGTEHPPAPSSPATTDLWDTELQGTVCSGNALEQPKFPQFLTPCCPPQLLSLSLRSAEVSLLSSYFHPQPSSVPGNNSISATKVGQMTISYFLVVLEIKYS